MDAKRHSCAAVWPLLLLAMCIGVCRAHVALTFPPARQPAWDFLDSGRTPPPCGVPKGSLKTSILSGSTFNVTWHLGYPHRGGYRIQVLDASEKPILDLTNGGQQNKSSVFVEGDPTALSYLVQLPKDLECRDCTIRLIRQASEWGKNYMFWSCADVDIIPRPEYRETCSGHGKDIAGRCRCNPLYSGHRCQYRDECSEDKDCGRHGKCVNLEATTYPKKQCFCEMGWFGPQCNKHSCCRHFRMT
ncbi:Uncharacterized protein APZ42_032839 [Daphnia magna]|uniref:EGF-like domain-containing protein n=1 Tax=Daphnia magna TaxID=35525 RepID=A0A164LX70_9CRUS|nr:Uncharacterized protein APZ42_032839 [Daphnia magna]